jgi:hypothetical protein
VKKGIVLLMFGEEYKKIGKACLKHSMKNTKLPFKVFQGAQEKNRQIKTTLVDHTPFDRTLYLDCDSIIQKPGIERVFELLEDCDVILRRFARWGKGDKVLNIYKRAMVQFGVTLPLDIWNGAFIAFKKNEAVARFFFRWNKYWRVFGKGREMPPLACAVKRSEGLKVKAIPRGFFNAEELADDVIVQHYTGQKFLDKFGLPKFERWTPFDSNPKDFSWTTM